MKCIAILMSSLFLIGCASRGSLSLGGPFEDTAKCPYDREIIYKHITVNTNWETQEQEVQYSWQCTKRGTLSDTYRVYETIITHKPEPQPKRERERYGRDLR